MALSITFTDWKLTETLSLLRKNFLTMFSLHRLNQILIRVLSIFQSRNLPYKSLDEITAVRFHEIKYQNNITKMDKNWNPKKRYTDSQIVSFNYDWFKLTDEYFELVKDQRGKSRFRKKKQETALSLKIQLMDQIIKTLSYCELNKLFLPLSAYNEFIEQTSTSLKKISSGLQKDGDVYEWIKKLINYNDGLKTKYSLDTKNETEGKEAEFSDFYKELAYIEMALEKDNIPEDINMTKWIVYKNQVHAKIHKHGK